MKHFLILFALIAFVAPVASAQINIEYTELVRLGRGTAKSLDWHPDGEVLAIGGSAGLWLYNTEFEQMAHFEAGYIRHVAWSPGGDSVALVTDSNIQIWAIDSVKGTGNRTHSIEEPHNLFFNHLSWSPSGQYLVINSLDENFANTIAYIWDSESGEIIQTIFEVGFAMTWSPDGSLLADGLGYSGVGLWDAITGRKIQTLEGIESELYFGDVTFNPDGTMLAAGTSLPASLHIWDTATGTLANTPDTTSDMSALRRVRWSPDGRSIAVVGGVVEGMRFQSVEILDVAALEQIDVFGMPDGIWDVTWTPNSQKITAIGNSGTIYDWTLGTETPTSHLLHQPSVQSAAWSPDGTRLAISTVGETRSPVMIWDVDLGEVPVNYEPETIFFPQITQTIRWMPDGQSIVTLGKNLPIWIAVYFVYQWDAYTGEIQSRLLEVADQGGPMPVVDWTHDFSRIARSWYDFNSFSIATSWQDKPELEITVSQEIITEIMWSPDGGKIATLSTNEDDDAAVLETWNALTGERLAVFEITNWRSTMNWSPDGERLSLIVPDHDNGTYTMQIIDAMTGEAFFTRHYDTVISALWSPDSSRLALDIGADVDEVSIFEIVDSTSGDIMVTKEFAGHLSTDWHPSGDLLAVAVEDMLLFIDGITGEILRSAPGAGMTSLDWSPDGTKLALFNIDQTTHIWQVQIN